jgi:hypothetical protein
LYWYLIDRKNEQTASTPDAKAQSLLFCQKKKAATPARTTAII